jgi:hypothetical protein
VAAPGLDCAVHTDLAVLDEQLGLAAGLRRSGQLEERA